MEDSNLNRVFPTYLSSKVFSWFDWAQKASEQTNNISQKPKLGTSSLNLNNKFIRGEDLHLLQTVKALVHQINQSEGISETLENQFIENKNSTYSLDSDSSAAEPPGYIGAIPAAAELASKKSIIQHPWFKNVHLQKASQNESTDKDLINGLNDILQVRDLKNSSSEDSVESTKETMSNYFRRSPSPRSAPPPPLPPPQEVATTEWTDQLEEFWNKLAQCLPVSLRNQTTLNIVITISGTLIAWLFLSWITQLIVSFICVSAAIFLLSAILTPQTNAWFVANFMLSFLGKLRQSLSDIFLKLSVWLRPPTQCIQNQRQSQPHIQNRRV